MSLVDIFRRLKTWLVPSGGVEERTVKSGIWVGISNVGNRGLQIILLVVLARILDPKDFGLMGIALLTTGSLKHLTNLGINEALIQKVDENVDNYLNTVLTLEIGRSLLIFSGVYLAAPVIADFFAEPRATLIIRVTALSPLIMSVRNPGIIYFQKDLEFHKQTLYRMSYSVTRFVVGIGYAILSPTVWALVVSYVVADTVRLFVSYAAHGYRPWPAFDWEKTKELIDYGKWITGGSILYFIYNKGDDTIVGRLLDATSLGFYQMAFQLASAPGTEISGIVRQVMFPSFSKLQEDKEAMREAFFRTVQMATFISFPASIGIIVVAPTFVQAFMGDAWAPMIPALQLLAVFGLLLSVTNTYNPVWKTLNRPDYGTKMGAVKVVSMAILIFPLTTAYGIEGAALTVVIASVFPVFPLSTYMLVSMLDTSYRRLAIEVAYPAAASLLMGGVVFAARRTLVDSPTMLAVLALVLVGIVSYAVAVLVMTRRLRWNIDRNLRSLVDAVS